MFCVVAVFSVPMHFIFTHYISNERESISLSNDTTNYIIKVIIKVREMVNTKHVFHFYFLNKDVKHIHMKGSVSQIFYLGLSFCFIPKNG